MPLKWTEDRLENLLGSYQGRGIEGELELALDRDGRMLGLRARLLADLGAYLLPTTAVPPITAAMLITGCYEIAAAEVQVTGVATNKVPTGPYRGAGRPDAAYMLEAIVDRAARELGIDRVRVAASQPDQALSAPDAAWLRVRLRRFRALPRPCRRARVRRRREAGPAWPCTSSAPAASGRRPGSSCSQAAGSRSRPAPARTARATRRRSRSWPRSASGSTPTRSRSATATATRCRRAWARSAAAPWRWPARRSRSRSTS